MQGYWIQNALVGGKQIFRIQHSTSPKEQALIFERMTDIMVMPIDQDLDGRYEMFLLLSPKDQRIIDLLVLTEEGWFRLGTPEEFEARQKIADENRRALKELNRTVQDAFDKAAKKWNQ